MDFLLTKTTVYYTQKGAETLLSFVVFRIVHGTGQALDIC